MARPTISLVIADTDTYTLALNAVQSCVTRFPVDDVLIFSDRREAWGSFDIVPVAPLRSQADYSNLIINVLPNHLKTDFFLVVQFDGFIINQAEFSPHFFHYDYIGAPWGWFPHFNVGNGGFSWRSRKFAEAGARLGYAPDSGALEDVFLCRGNRIALEERYGCHFAEDAVAAHFSLEFGQRRFPTFGFHGIFHLPAVYQSDLGYLTNNLTARILKSDNQFSQISQPLKALSPVHFDELVQRRQLALGAAPP